MQIVIDISKEKCDEITPFLNGETTKNGFNVFMLLETIKNGVPVPEGHGDLIDRDDLYNWLSNADTSEIIDALNEGMDIKELPAIIAENN